MKKIITLISLLLIANLAFAQNTVKGTVYDNLSEPVAGAYVIVKGSDNGTMTDSKGRYSINAKAGDVLVFSCLGMVDYSITLKNETTVNAKMMPDNYSLDDVVVIGYGTAKKSDLTGAVASIKTDELKNTKVGMASSALQGMAAGVQVTNGNLKPGADAGIIIRGVGSVNAGSGPLYVVDGVPMSGMQDISMVDIASIEVLKDASSASIYGSRGSNGVVLITTKRGDGAKTRISLNAQGGIQTMLNKQDMMDAQQYYKFINDNIAGYTWTTDELRHISKGESTDWQDAVTQMGSFQNYNVSVASGTQKMNHYLGIDYYNQKGIIKNSSFDKITLRYNTDAKVTDWFRFGARFNTVYSKLMNINEEQDSGYGTMHSAVTAQPTAPIFTEDGDYYDGFLNTKANPVAMVNLLDKGTKKLMAVGSVYFEVEPIKNLVLKTDNTLHYTMFRVNEYEDGRMGQHYPVEGRASIMSNFTQYYQTENTITYTLDKAGHKLTAMAGFSASKSIYETSTAQSKGLNPITKYNNLTGAAEHGPNSSYANASTMASFYARATYNYDDRYLATLTMRGDGSSRFAPGHRWGFFPSLALAWRASEESFLKGTQVTNLKLRASIGRLGNQNIGDYAYAALVSEGGYFNDYVFGADKATGAVYSSISNPNLTWEKANQVDVGLDFGFFDNRLAGTIEGYYKHTSDLLWTVPLPYESGYTSSLTNVGSLANSGVEFTLNTININTSKFSWRTSFNISYNRNKVLSLYDGKQDVGKWIFVGHSLNEYYLLKSDGIWQLDEASEAATYGCQPGDRKIRDIKKDGVINGDDRTFCGQSTPTVYGGFANTFNIWNFDLTIFMNYAAGYKINNALLRSQNAYNRWGNMSQDYYNNYWTLERPSNVYPAPREAAPYANGDGTDANLQDGGYLRIKNIELGYTLPYKALQKLHVSSLRLFVSVQNLYTFTKFTGYDVEAWDTNNSYPGARAYIAGISLNF